MIPDITGNVPFLLSTQCTMAENHLFVVSRHMIRRENVTCVKYNGLIG